MELDYTQAVKNGNKKQIKIMIDAINAYQKTKVYQREYWKADGIIDADGITYNDLKSAVKAKLKSERL